MKQVYRIGDDLFMVIAFTAFVVGAITRLLEIQEIFWGVTPRQLLSGAIVCLLFSIALSLRDMAQPGK